MASKERRSFSSFLSSSLNVIGVQAAGSEDRPE